MADKPQLSPGFARLTDAGYPLLFVLGGALMSVLGNSIYDMARLGFGDGGALRVAIVAAGLLIVLAWVVAAHMRRMATRGAFRVESQPQAPEKRGLICLVSNEPVVRRAVEYHSRHLEHLWLVASSATAATAEGLKTEFEVKHEGLQVSVRHLQDEDVFGPEATRAILEGIYADLPEGLAARDVIADFTGGNKAMTAGVVLACLDADRDVQYVPQLMRPGPDGRLVVERVGDPIYIHVVRQ
jgi:hypothetical protein